MGDQFISQREFDQYQKGAEAEHARLRARVKALEDQRQADADRRRAGLAQRIAAIGAGAAVVAACVAVVELWLSSGR